MKLKLLMFGSGLAFFIALASTEYDAYKRDSLIQKNPGFAHATILGHQTETSTRKGRTKVSYEIAYEFKTDDGTPVQGNINMTQGHGEEAVKAGGFDLVYSKMQPAIHSLKREYKGNRTPASFAKQVMIMTVFSAVFGAFVGYLLAWKFGWLKKEEDAVAVPAAVEQKTA